MSKVHPPSLRYGATSGPKSKVVGWLRAGKRDFGKIVRVAAAVFQHSRAPEQCQGAHAF